MSLDTHLEELIKKAIAPLVQEIQELKSQIKQRDYPPTLTVKQAAEIANRGTAFIYESAHDPSFPKIQGEGGKITIPTDLYLEWLRKKALSKSTGLNKSA
jgi:hypothetical protein